MKLSLGGFLYCCKGDVTSFMFHTVYWHQASLFENLSLKKQIQPFKINSKKKKLKKTTYVPVVKKKKSEVCH